MTEHLSDEQFAECFVGSVQSAELLRHVRECGRCSEELERFGGAVVSLRSAIRNRVEHAESQAIQDLRQTRPVVHALVPKWQWAVAVAAMVLFGLIPVITLETKQPARTVEDITDAEAAALMDAINLHLSRDLPAPMEPLMVIPDNQFIIDAGGIP
jgi:hypothetical protein